MFENLFGGNSMMTVTDYLYAKASHNRVPLGAGFELTPVCNFSCKMCYVRRTPEQVRREGKQLIPWQRWLRLAEQCRDAGMLYLLLTGGEPFLYPGFRELYERLHDMGLLLSINSNGTLIDRETVAWLKERMPTRINVTLYGASPDTYERICGNRAGYQKTVDAIDLLVEAGIPVVINASMVPENADDLEKIIEFGRARNLNTRVATYMFPPVRREAEETDSRFTPEESARLNMRRLRCQMDEQAYWQLLRDRAEGVTSAESSDDWGNTEEFMRCRAGRSSFWVSWEGMMSACGLMDFPMSADPFRESFLDCWQRLTDAVRSTPVLAGCRGCEKRDACGVCAAMIHAETGTLNEKAPYLCQMTDHILEFSRMEWEERQNETKC